MASPRASVGQRHPDGAVTASSPGEPGSRQAGWSQARVPAWPAQGQAAPGPGCRVTWVSPGPLPSQVLSSVKNKKSEN